MSLRLLLLVQTEGAMDKAIDRYAESAIAKTASLMLDANLQIQVSQALLREALWKEALRRASGNKCKAAALLGVHRNTFSRMLSPELRRHSKHGGLELVS